MSECGPEFDIKHTCAVRHCEFKGESGGVITVQLGHPNLMEPDDESSLRALLQQHGYDVLFTAYIPLPGDPESG